MKFTISFFIHMNSNDSFAICTDIRREVFCFMRNTPLLPGIDINYFQITEIPPSPSDIGLMRRVNDLSISITHRRGLRRAVALFLITYCLVASITETGLGDASPYLLELVVAASLLAAPVDEEAP